MSKTDQRLAENILKKYLSWVNEGAGTEYKLVKVLFCHLGTEVTTKCYWCEAYTSMYFEMRAAVVNLREVNYQSFNIDIHLCKEQDVCQFRRAVTSETDNDDN